MNAVKGAVLSGGGSTRMGRSKGGVMLPWGLTMESNARKTVGRATGSCAVVSGYSGLRDVRPGMGPMGGIETVLWKGEGDAWLFLPCDMPFVSVGLLGRLIGEFCRNSRQPAVVTCSAIEPLIAVVPVHYREKVTNAVDMGHLKVGRFWMDCGYTSVEVLNRHELADVDHPWEIPA